VESRFRLREWIVDPESGSITGPEGESTLSQRAVALLTELASHAGDVRSRQQILETVWPGERVSSQDLEALITEICEGLGDDPSAPTYIENAPGGGHRLVAAVSWLDTEEVPTERFEIQDQIGGGGMGVVYRAVDSRLQRTVALKFLPPEWGRNPKAKERFLVEARAAAALDHANICPIHEISETEEGRLFLVMPFYEGGSLSDRLRGGRLGIQEAVRITSQAARGLEHAHAAGILHRDIKPGNLMLTADDTVKVLDFGLAKFAGGQALTATGAVLGTPAYMSPEQARGLELDRRTDIWSLGVVLYEMLTGRRPFGGSNDHSVLHAILDGSSEVRLGPDVPEPLRRVVARMLERDVAARYATCGALLRDLEATVSSAWSSGSGLEGMPTAATELLPPATGPDEPATPAARGRRLRPMLVLGAVVLAAAGLAGWFSTRGSESAPAPGLEVSAEATPVELTRVGRGHLERHYDEKQVEIAVGRFENALEIDPEHAPAYAGLAEAYQRLHGINPDEVLLSRALDSARRAVELNEYLASARISLGLVLVSTGELEGGATELRQALEVDPLSSPAHRELGVALWRQQDPDGAREELEKGLALDETDWWAWTQLGSLAFSQGDYAGAEEAFVKTTELTPQNYLAFRNVAAAMQMQQRYGEAAAALQSSLEIRPSDSTYSNLGTLLFVQGNFSAAVQAFERAVDLGPNNLLYWGNLGDAYRWAPGRKAEAAAAFERAAALALEFLETDPSNTTTRSRLALFYAKAGNAEGAQTTLREVLDAGTPDLTVWYRALLTYELAGERESALGALEQAVTAGYPVSEIEKEPELIELRRDRRYHEIVGSLTSTSDSADS